MTRRQFLALIVPLLAVLLGFLALIVIERTGAGAAPPYDRDFAAFVRERMATEFVYGVQDDRRAWEAEFNALNAWIGTFDPYGAVVAPWQLEESQERSSGQYGGIGIRIGEGPPPNGPLQSVKVTGVKPGGPADDAGVMVGDDIVAVEGTPIAEICPDGRDVHLRNRIRGERGSAVTLTLQAPDGVRRDVEVTRDRIDTGSVYGVRWADEENRIGYARIGANSGYAGFQANTANDLREHLEGLLKEGMRGLVLDVRRNGGGLLDQAVAVADFFLAEGVIVRQRGRARDFTEVYEAQAADTLTAFLPLALLVDGGSASASEILVGALRDHRRAVVVGTNTFGKFLVQLVDEVPMQIGRALFKRTTSIYETPSGHHYQRSERVKDDPLAGIAPDVYVPVTREQSRKIDEIFNHEFFAEWNPDRAPVHADFVDPQLEAAVAVLVGATPYPRIVE